MDLINVTLTSRNTWHELYITYVYGKKIQKSDIEQLNNLQQLIKTRLEINNRISKAKRDISTTKTI